jgi:hypothetical protein
MPIRFVQGAGAAATLLCTLCLIQCGAKVIGLEEKRDPRCLVAPSDEGLNSLCGVSVDPRTGTCTGNCGPFSSTEECDIVCRHRGCNAAQPCPSDNEECVFLSAVGTGYCATRCNDDACPLGNSSSPLHTCALAEPDYGGSCPEPCSVCGLHYQLYFFVDPEQVTATLIDGQEPPVAISKALFQRAGGPEQDVTALAEWAIDDPTLGSFTAPGTLALSGIAGKTFIRAHYTGPAKSFSYSSGAVVSIQKQ